MQVLGPFRTTLMREQSIGLALKTDDRRVVYLFVDPRVLSYYLELLPELDLGPGGFVLYLKPDGSLLHSVGQVPAAIGNDREQRADGVIRAERCTTVHGLQLIGEIKQNLALRYWLQMLWIAVPVALFALLFLIYLFARQSRESEALDYDLKLALVRDQFEVHYQPILDLETRRCVGAEALIRWRHPAHGLILPKIFIPKAEETGLIVPMTKWLIARIASEQARLGPDASRLYTSVNVSSIHLNSGNVDDLVTGIKRASLDSGQRIVVEITESNLLREDNIPLDAIARLRRAGARVALDDFGTGYSGLSLVFALVSAKCRKRSERHFAQSAAGLC